MKKKDPYIPVLPGHIKDADDTRTDILQALGMEDLKPMNIGSYNEGYHDPPVAAIMVNGEQYSVKKVLERVGNRMKKVDALEKASTGSYSYGFCWDKAAAKGSRLGAAAGLPIDTANFGHFGSVNADYSNPFDAIYPWSGRKLCNIDLALYAALRPGDSITDCVKAWEGDEVFSYDDEAGVWVYTPEFWGTAYEENGLRYFYVSAVEVEGYIHYPEGIDGRWHGGIYSVGGKNLLLPKPGMPGKRIAVGTLHTYAKNYGATLDNIFSVDASTLLMVVEYATMNSQAACGSGADSMYRQSNDVFTAASTGAVVHVAKNAAASFCIPGAIFDIGTSNGGVEVGSFIVSSVANNDDGMTLDVALVTVDGVTPANVTVSTTHFWSVHGVSNTKDAAIGSKTGYLGTNGKCQAYYRGMELYSNIWHYVLGAYRQSGTGHIWVAKDEAEADAYDALNTSVHRDTGLTLFASGYVKELGMAVNFGLCIPPFCTAVGGSSTDPVGDYCYTPDVSAGNTILLLGGYADDGASAGRFCGHWHYTSWNSNWPCGARPRLKNPLGDC